MLVNFDSFSILACTLSIDEQPETERESSLDIILRNYRDSFTVHGLTKVFTGYFWEQWVWSGMVQRFVGFLGVCCI